MIIKNYILSIVCLYISGEKSALGSVKKLGGPIGDSTRNEAPWNGLQENKII